MAEFELQALINEQLGRVDTDDPYYKFLRRTRDSLDQHLEKEAKRKQDAEKAGLDPKEIGEQIRLNLTGNLPSETPLPAIRTHFIREDKRRGNRLQPLRPQQGKYDEQWSAIIEPLNLKQRALVSSVFSLVQIAAVDAIADRRGFYQLRAKTVGDLRRMSSEELQRIPEIGPKMVGVLKGAFPTPVIR